MTPRNAMPVLPTCVVRHVLDFLELQDLAAWRRTSKQEFAYVEHRTKEQWKGFRSLQRFETHSWFLDFMSQTYLCETCGMRSSGSPDAESLQLCDYCFIQTVEEATYCEVCDMSFFMNTGEVCVECEWTVCPDCSTHGELRQCSQCLELFCVSCIEEHED